MRSDVIKEVGITSDGGIFVKPSIEKFPYIYREAMEVSWSNERLFLFGPKPRKWSLTDWFLQVLRAVKEQGCDLQLSDRTEWVNVPQEIRVEIEEAAAGV